MFPLLVQNTLLVAANENFLAAKYKILILWLCGSTLMVISRYLANSFMNRVQTSLSKDCHNLILTPSYFINYEKTITHIFGIHSILIQVLEKISHQTIPGLIFILIALHSFLKYHYLFFTVSIIWIMAIICICLLRYYILANQLGQHNTNCVRYFNSLRDKLSHPLLIWTYNLNRSIEHELSLSVDNIMEQKRQCQRLAATFDFSIFMITIFLQGWLFLNVFQSVYGNTFTIGLVIFNYNLFFVFSTMKVIEDIIKFLDELSGANNHLINLHLILQESMPTRSQQINTLSPISTIEFRNVKHHFSPLLINFTLQRGQTLCIQGASGTGKTTLFEILLKFKSYGGTILLNEHDLSDFTQEQIREQILYIPQKDEIFTGSIHYNLSLGQNIDEKDIIRVLHEVQLSSLISRLYEEIDINRLSGGELKRLCIARSLLSTKKIWLLDEITNGLDDRNLECILNVIFENKKDNIMIFIDHSGKIRTRTNFLINLLSE